MSAKTSINRRGPPMRRSRSLAPVTPPPRGISNPLHSLVPQDGSFISHRSSADTSILELQRISYIFQGTSFISEAEFVVTCKSIMNLLQYSHSEDTKPWQQVLLVEVVENAVITFVTRVLPLVFQELITPTSLLHPISPPMVVSLLDVADTHVNGYGDFFLQLRMAAIHQLLRDNGDVSLAFSMCQMLPRIQPNSKWQPVINPLKAHPVSNIQGSISLPEIYPPVFPASPSLSSSPMLDSPIPSLSSLLNCSSSSSIPIRNFHTFDLDNANTISKSISQPTMSSNENPSPLNFSSSAPNLQYALAPINALTSVVPPIIACEGHSLDTSLEVSLFSPSLFSPIREDSPGFVLIGEGSEALVDMPDTHIQLPGVEDNPNSPPPQEAARYPSIVSTVSQDDLSRLISCSDVGEEPPSPSLFTPNMYARSPTMDADFIISIGPPALEDTGIAPGSSKTDSATLSPLLNQSSSPLSSPPQIIAKDNGDNFRNTFGTEIQRRPPSPYNKRLRSASNNPAPAMKRVLNAPRQFSVSSRRQPPLDPDLAALILPSPPTRKSTEVQVTEEAVVSRKKGRNRGPYKAKRTHEGTTAVQDDDDSSPSRHRWQNVTGAGVKSVDKENC